MKKLITFISVMIILLFAIQVQAIQNPLVYYKLNLTYNYGNITINSVGIELSDNTIQNSFGFYSAEVVDFNGTLLNVTLFAVPNKILYDTVDNKTGEINGGGTLELNQTSFEVFVPYYPNAEKIEIYNQNMTKLSGSDLSQFSKEKPQKNESKTPLEQTPKALPKENFIDKISNYWWVLIIILVILLIILFYSLRKK